MVVNGRISDHSFPKYQKLRFLIQGMFGKVSLVLAQTEEYARRFVALGCPAKRVQVTGSLKYDTAQTDGQVSGAARLAEQINLGAERLWVLGGTGPGEEAIGLEVFKRLRQESAFESLRLAIVPRKPERFSEVAGLINQAGFGYVHYSEFKQKDSCVSGKPTVILGRYDGRFEKVLCVGVGCVCGAKPDADGGVGYDGACGTGQMHDFRPAYV